jgi:hypothetical protein
MPSSHAERNFSASMRLLRRVGNSCALLPELGELRTVSELTSRARIVRSALNARALFEDLNKHLAGLSAALADYQMRKQQIGPRKQPAPAPANSTASSRSSARTR